MLSQVSEQYFLSLFLFLSFFSSVSPADGQLAWPYLLILQNIFSKAEITNFPIQSQQAQGQWVYGGPDEDAEVGQMMPGMLPYRASVGIPVQTSEPMQER